MPAFYLIIVHAQGGVPCRGGDDLCQNDPTANRLNALFAETPDGRMRQSGIPVTAGILSLMEIRIRYSEGVIPYSLRKTFVK